MFFRVKYYVSDPLLLSEPKTRYLYYLQLRHNYLSINHKLSEEKYFSIASLALVADYGPFNPQFHTNTYFNIDLYFPKWVFFIFAFISYFHTQKFIFYSVDDKQIGTKVYNRKHGSSSQAQSIHTIERTKQVLFRIVKRRVPV